MRLKLAGEVSKAISSEMDSINPFGDRALRLGLWPALLCAICGLAIAGAFLATSRWSDNAFAIARDQEISGLTIEQQSTGMRRGLIVTSVASRGPAHDAGIAAGDVVAAVNGRPVASTTQLRDFVESGSATGFHVALLRGSTPFSLDLPEAPQPDK